MKKSLLIGFLTGIIVLSGCGDSNSPVERGYSDLPPIPYCEENGGVVETIQKEGETIWICTFEDKSYCVLEDFANKKCNKGDNEKFDYYTQAKEICIERGGQIIEDHPFERCIFENDTFCDLMNEDLHCALSDFLSTSITRLGNPNLPSWKGTYDGVDRNSTGTVKGLKRSGEWIYYGYSGTVVLKGNYSGGNLDGEWYRYGWKDTIHAHEIYENGQSKQLLECDNKCKKISGEEGIIKNIINIIDTYNSLLYPSN